MARKSKIDFRRSVSGMSKRGIQATPCHRHGYLQKYSKQHDVTCRGDSYSPLSRMENSQTCAQSVMRYDEEDVSMRQDDEDEEVEETLEDAGAEDDEDRDEVATRTVQPEPKVPRGSIIN